MRTRNEKLDRLTVGTPCPEGWHTMQGDDRRRHCSRCDRTVHDLARLSPREIAVLLEATGGRLCARITRDGCGRLVTGEAVPVPLSPGALPLRASPLAVAVVGGLLAFGNGQVAAEPAAAPAAVSSPLAPEAEPGRAVAPEASFEDYGAGDVITVTTNAATSRYVTSGIVAMPAALSLFQSFEESELVVLATAGPSVALDRDAEYGEVATEFRIRVTVKGKATSRKIRVFHGETGSVEERRGKLPVGTQVLAFLRLREGETGRLAGYEATDGDFGLKQDLSLAELQAWGDRLTALARLERHGELDPQAFREWLVATAEEPLTRLEAARELGRKEEELTDDQKARLTAAFRSAPGNAFADLFLFFLAHGWEGDALLPVLADRLEGPVDDDGEIGLPTLGGLADHLEIEELSLLVAAAQEELDAFEDSIGTSDEDIDRYLRKSRAIEEALRPWLVRVLRQPRG